MTRSMTAYASRTGTLDGVAWQWEMRGVNARGLDLRMRVPDGLGAIEMTARKTLAQAFSRGNVTLSLRITREQSAGQLGIDQAQLDRVLGALDVVQERAFEQGVTLGQPTAADVLATHGVITTGVQTELPDEVFTAIEADIGPLIDDFVAMRAAEGAALQEVMIAQIDSIAALIDAARTAAEARRADSSAAMTAALQRVMDTLPDIGADRVAQELALLAVKSDISEEIDRLRAHVAAARALVLGETAAGRKLDFLAQELHREANTLCAKAGAPALTAVGIDLKAVIDRLREQVQNVE